MWGGEYHEQASCVCGGEYHEQALCFPGITLVLCPPNRKVSGNADNFVIIWFPW